MMIKLCNNATEHLPCTNCLRIPNNTNIVENQLWITNDDSINNGECNDYLDADFLKMFPNEEDY
jgi:hypothetical protein